MAMRALIDEAEHANGARKAAIHREAAAVSAAVGVNPVFSEFLLNGMERLQGLIEPRAVVQH